MYPYGAPSVRCSSCRFVTEIGVCIQSQMIYIYIFVHVAFFIILWINYHWNAVARLTFRARMHVIMVGTIGMHVFMLFMLLSLYVCIFRPFWINYDRHALQGQGSCIMLHILFGCMIYVLYLCVCVCAFFVIIWINYDWNALQG